MSEHYESGNNIESFESEESVSGETNFETTPNKNELCEINTYDAIPVSCKQSKGSRVSILKRIYSFVAVFTVLLSVIFSSAEIFDIIFNDMGTGNAIIKRIFGNEVSGDSLDLSNLIITNSFLTINERTLIVESKPPINEDGGAESENFVPQETIPESPPSNKPNESETTFPPEIAPDEPEKTQYPILPMDMSLLSYGDEYIYNSTSLSPDISALASAKLNNYYQDESPLVLVIHTHGTESYMPEGAMFYTDEGELARSEDHEENMIAVGKDFVRVLEENGINTIHCVIMHDKESYRESYSRAAESIAKYLKQYPSIRYVFDLHRDSLMRSGGELISAVTTIGGESHAQIMPVIGTGARDWEENMTFALKLRNYLNVNYTNLCRPVCLRESTYNQNMSAVSVLLEIGTSGNTLEEAKKAAVLTANAVATLIKGNA